MSRSSYLLRAGLHRSNTTLAVVLTAADRPATRQLFRAQTPAPVQSKLHLPVVKGRTLVHRGTVRATPLHATATLRATAQNVAIVLPRQRPTRTTRALLPRVKPSLDPSLRAQSKRHSRLPASFEVSQRQSTPGRNTRSCSCHVQTMLCRGAHHRWLDRHAKDMRAGLTVFCTQDARHRVLRRTF